MLSCMVFLSQKLEIYVQIGVVGLINCLYKVDLTFDTMCILVMLIHCGNILNMFKMLRDRSI